jgi:hypothetical protein
MLCVCVCVCVLSLLFSPFPLLFSPVFSSLLFFVGTVSGAFRADQFRHRGSFRAHYLHTAPEIWQQLDGRVDAFVDFVGSGGTFSGCAAFFKVFVCVCVCVCV